MSMISSADGAVMRMAASCRGHAMDCTIYSHGLAAFGAAETEGGGAPRDSVTKASIGADRRVQSSARRFA